MSADVKMALVRMICCSDALDGIKEGEARQCMACGNWWTLRGITADWFDNGDASLRGVCVWELSRKGPACPDHQPGAGHQSPLGETPDQRGLHRAKELLSEWLETPNEGDAMVDCLLGVIREAHAALGGEA